MKKIKLTSGIFIMLMIASTMVFSQTAQTQKQTAKTTTVKSDQKTVENSSNATASQSTSGNQVQKMNFVDKNNDGVCDNCGKKKAECNQANCNSKQGNCKSSQSGCSGAQKKSCSHSCGGH
jgi:hypothetical protein